MRTLVLLAIALSVPPAWAQLSVRAAKKQCRVELRDCLRLAKKVPSRAPVQARKITESVEPYGGIAQVTFFINADATARIDVDVLLGGVLGPSLYVCYSNMHLVQGARQLELCAVDEPSDVCCRVSPGICADQSEGVTSSLALSAFPAWFDLNAPFRLVWSDATVEVP